MNEGLFAFEMMILAVSIMLASMAICGWLKDIAFELHELRKSMEEGEQE